MGKATRFPKFLYVRRETDGADEFFVADKGLPAVEEDTHCAVYELKRVGSVVVQRDFVE